MPKKSKTPREILSKAADLFDRGNYAAALKEFEKLPAPASENRIAEKIEICRAETRKTRVEDLIKRGRKHTRKKHSRKALECLEEAYALSNDKEIGEKAAALKSKLKSDDSLSGARTAEAAGQFEEAAALYHTLSPPPPLPPDEHITLRRACCLARAGKPHDAARAIEDLPVNAADSSPQSREMLSQPQLAYDYGFVLAATGSYYECLKIWASIECDDDTFPKQQETVRSLLEEDLIARSNRNEGWKRIYEEAKYLADSAGRKRLSKIVERSRYELISELWGEERYEAIPNLLVPYPAEIDDERLALYAKVYFKAMEASGECPNELALFWLPAVNNPKLLESLSSGEERRDAVREKLISKAQTLIENRARAGSAEATKTLGRWNREKKLTGQILEMVGSRDDLFDLIAGPLFARRFGRADRILALIRDNRETFDDPEDYLRTGAFYSPAMDSMFHLENGDYKTALAYLPEKTTDKFTSYCREKTRFEYGMWCIESGKPGAERYLKSARALFDMVPNLEQKLVRSALDAEDEPEELWRYEQALRHVWAALKTPPITEALSLIISWRAVCMGNRNLSAKTIETMLRDALAINPSNEHARSTLKKAGKAVELQELHTAINSLKMNRAARIAVRSEHPMVKEKFFLGMQEFLDEAREPSAHGDIKFDMLSDVNKWCANVDPEHPVSRSARTMLKNMENT